MPGKKEDLLKAAVRGAVVKELVGTAVEQAKAAEEAKKVVRVVCGSDHAGTELKLTLMQHLTEKGFACEDVGNYDPNDRDDDYPVYGEKVARMVAAGEADFGLLVCGTGLGISLAANKVKGIRACVCSEPYTARMSRAHNNCNILCMGARVVGRELAKMITDEFFMTAFEGGRHQRRVDMIRAIEEQP